MVPSENFGYLYIYLWEWLALPFYLFAILFMGRIYQMRKQKEDSLYDYYLKGLGIKLFGGIGFAVIYFYYYQGGDTTSYYESALAMKNLMFHSFPDWLSNEFGAASPENYSKFTAQTGHPLHYMYYDPQTLMVIKIITPLMIPSLGGYLISTLLLAWLSYSGLWRLFMVFSAYYPNLKKYFFISILCFPSVIFWGSGILKDTITLSCSCWLVYCIFNVFIMRRKVLKYLFLMIPFFIVILFIKPYIIMALMPGSLMWIFSQRIYKIKNGLVRFLIVPFIFLVCFAGGYILLKSLGSIMGKFSIDRISTTAKVTEEDLKQDYYGGHSFDLGTFENTPTGYMKIFPKAFIAGTYRPFLWEAGNVVMLLSGLENTYLLYLTFLMFKRTGITNIFKRLLKEPLLFFAFSFSVFFAFAVGLTTSNFGALVRFKVAYLPYLASALFILSAKTEEEAVEADSTSEISTADVPAM